LCDLPLGEKRHGNLPNNKNKTKQKTEAVKYKYGRGKKADFLRSEFFFFSSE